jgi:hypothetical protein
MTLSNKELKEIQKFNKTMIKITGLKGNKFAYKIMTNLLKKRSPWKKGGGGGTNNNQLASNAPNVEIVNDLAGYTRQIQRNNRNQTINNATLVQLQQGGNFTPLQLLAIQGNQEAIQLIFFKEKMNMVGNFLLKLLLTGMTLGGTYRTWYLFDNLSRVTRNALETVTPPTPAPAPAPAPTIGYRNLFGLLGTGATQAPAPVPQIAPPPEGLATWMINWAFSGGNNIVYRIRIVLAWFAEVLNDLVGTGQLTGTIATFILLTIVSLFILKMYENGIQLWVGFAGIDTRNATAPTIQRSSSDQQQRQQERLLGNSRGFERGRRRRPRRTLRQRSRRRQQLTDAATGIRTTRGDSTFTGFNGGGNRRKSRRKRRKSRRKRKRRKSRRKRRKSRRKRKR